VMVQVAMIRLMLARVTRTIFTPLQDIAAQKCQGIHQIAHKSEKQEDSLLLTQSATSQGRQIYIDE
jgi:hypothetical protein